MAKIDLSKLKSIAKGLGALRSYASLLWPGVIVLAGIIVLTAALLLGRGLKAKVNRESMPTASRVNSLLETAPSLEQAEEEKKYEDAYESDANLISLLAVQTTQRELLAYNIFPQPKGTSALIFTGFGDQFRQKVENLIKEVNGGECPSDEVLEASVERVGSPSTSYRGRGPSEAPGAGSEASMIIEQICQTKANSASVYANTKTVSGYDFWEMYEYAGQEESVKDCWYWQLGYWIIEDLFTTVDKMNQGSSRVSSSPVKRIIGVGFDTPEELVKEKADAVSQKMPKYITNKDDQLTASLTGRVSDESLDVVHFSIIAVVRADSLLSFMEELCSEKEHQFRGYRGDEPARTFKHNQISILESRVKTVSPELPDHRNYRYGKEPVVQVELICEYIFNKKGYEAIYPEALKEKATPETDMSIFFNQG